jgi:hypothetical protein
VTPWVGVADNTGRYAAALKTQYGRLKQREAATR